MKVARGASDFLVQCTPMGPVAVAAAAVKTMMATIVVVLMPFPKIRNNSSKRARSEVKSEMDNETMHKHRLHKFIRGGSKAT